MHIEPSGELLLGEASSTARLDQQLAKSGLAKGMDGFSDSARARGHRRGRLNHRIIPKVDITLELGYALSLWKFAK